MGRLWEGVDLQQLHAQDPSPSFYTLPAPFCPWTWGSEIASTGLRRPVAEQEVYRWGGGFNTPFLL